MRVGITIDVDYPHVGEVRPTKLAQSLQRAGHTVVFICQNSGQGPLIQELEYGRVYRFGYFLNSRIFRLLGAPSPLNPFWPSWIARVARSERLDVLISSNLRIALSTILAGRLLHKPVVLDLQENNREVVKSYPRSRPHHYIIRNSHLVGFLENLCVKLADHTWVVIDERMDVMPAKLRNLGKTSVVCHTPSLEELDLHRTAPAKSSNDPFTLVYVGLFSPGVGSIEPILKALPYVLARDKNVRFLIGGGGKHLQALIERLGIQAHVVFSGLIAPQNMFAWLEQGDLGIIAYPVNAFTNTTISNKLFHYMAAGLPILSTDMTPTRRILDEVRCGRTIRQNSTYQEIAEIILLLKDAPAERAMMAQRGREAVLRKYNWTFDFNHALSCLENLVSSNEGSKSTRTTTCGRLGLS